MQIILAWELGGNYGHLAKLLCIARPLRQKGHCVLFVVKNGASVEQLLDVEKFHYMQAPQPIVRQNRSHKPVSFADILAQAGFGNFEVLRGLVLSWQEIFKTMEADVVVAQYAPVAQFSARLVGLPCLSLNTGFEYPPDVSPYPCFRPYPRLTPKQLLAREVELLKHINQISSHQSQFSYRSLQEILRSDISLLATIPELDHYRRRSGGCYIGPISLLDYGVTLHWREKRKVRIFLYLRPFRGIEHILQNLAVSGADVIAHIPGINQELAALYDNTTIRIIGSMVKLSSVLADMDVVITHGGHGLAAAALLAGVPMLMIPTTVEQWMMGRAVKQLRIGMSLGIKELDETFSAALERLLTDPFFEQMSQQMAEKYAGYNQQRAVAKLVNTIERLPAWKVNY